MGQARSVEDLQNTWQLNVKGWMKLGPVEIRLIIAAKDRLKLALASEVLQSDSKMARDLAVEVLEAMFTDRMQLKPAWNELAESGLSGDDVQDYREALFLYALEKLRSADALSIQHVYEDSQAVWRRTLPNDAMIILTKTYLDIVRPATITAFQESRGGR